MDAPTYPPAALYRRPTVVPRPVSTSTSIADLMRMPAAWAVLQEELRGIDQIVRAEALVPHLGNFAPRSLVVFGVLRAEQLDRVDARLRALNLQQDNLR